MSTNSNIFIENTDGTYTGIYCHWDGYIKNNGKILAFAYDTPEKLQQLIDLGDISKLGAILDASAVVQQYGLDFYQSPAFNALEEEKQQQLMQEYRSVYGDYQLPKYTNAYHRDRNEPLQQIHCESFLDVNHKQSGFIEYVYIAKRNDNHILDWYVQTDGKLRLLKDALIEEGII